MTLIFRSFEDGRTDEAKKIHASTRARCGYKTRESIDGQSSSNTSREAHSNNREFYHQHRSSQIVVEGYTYGSRQEIGSPYCQIVYADFNRKSYFPIGFRGGSRIEPSRAERSNPVRSSRYERTLLNRLTRSSFQSRSAIREEICIYI